MLFTALQALVVFVTVYFWTMLPMLHIQATWKGSSTPNPVSQVIFSFFWHRLALSATATLAYLVLT